MAETAQIEEQIEEHWQRECWNRFVVFLSTQEYRIQAGIPLPGTAQSGSSGWTTDTSSLPVFQVEDKDNEPDPPDDELLKDDESKQRLYLRAIFALLGNTTNTAAAAEVGISTRQLYRWRRLPEFVALYEKTKRELYESAVTGMKSVLVKAGIVGAKTLQQIAEDKKAPDTARVQASKALTALALQIQSIEGIESRLAELERAGIAIESSGTYTKIAKAEI